MYLYDIETAGDFWGYGGVRPGKKVSQSKGVLFFYQAVRRSMLDVQPIGKQPGNKTKRKTVCGYAS